MFASNQKSTGTGYTATVALLATAFIFIPGILYLSRSFGYSSLLLAASGSVLCLALARIAWKKSSRISIPSIELQESQTK